MRSIKALLGLLAVCTLAAVATPAGAAAEWNHVNLQSREGVQIAVDYQFVPYCHRFTQDGRSDNQIRFAEPVWLNVKGLPSGKQVDVDVEFWKQSYRLTGGSNPLLRAPQHFDRSLALNDAGDGRYTGQLGTVAVRHAVGSSSTDWNIGQKIRIKVDGVPLIDPISGTDQFLVFLDNKVGCYNP